MKKILFGITLSEIGGAQKIVYDLISALSENKYDISLVTSPNGELIDWIDNLNINRKNKIKVLCIDTLRREISPINDLISFIRIFKIIRKNEYDIVHLHSSKIGILGKIASFLNRVPLKIFTVHNWGIKDNQYLIKRKILGILERFTNILCDRIVCVSENIMRIGIRNKWINTNKAIVIKNGVEISEVSKHKLRNELNLNEELIIGTVMRLRDPKMPMFTIKVFNEVLKKESNIALVIIGDGPLKENCINLVNKLNISSKVYFLGARHDINELIVDFDIFTLFSKSEGLPISILEAMFSGKPIIASDVGGINEIVIHGFNGYLLDDNSYKTASDLIFELMKDIDKRKKFGENSKNLSAYAFNKNKMINAYETIYSEIK